MKEAVNFNTSLFDINFCKGLSTLGHANKNRSPP